jgi:hypothetical protein
MFKQNYLNELPDDCIKHIYKNLYDMSVKKISTCSLNKNIQFYYNLQEMMNDEEPDFHFPYLQIVSRKVNTHFKYLYDVEDGNIYTPKYMRMIMEQRWIEANAHKYFNPIVAHAKRVDAGLANTRKMLIDDHKIRYVRIRSDNLLFTYQKNQYLHRRFRKHFSGQYEAIITDDTAHDFKMFIDKGDIVIVFEDQFKKDTSMSCLGELLWIFDKIAYEIDSVLNDFFDDMIQERDEIYEKANPDELDMLRDPLEFNLRRIREIMNELEISDFLIDCNIKLEGETAVITKHKPVNVIVMSDNSEDSDYYDESETDEIEN